MMRIIKLKNCCFVEIRVFCIALCFACTSIAWGQSTEKLLSGTETFVSFQSVDGYLPLAEGGQPIAIVSDADDYKGVQIAVNNLKEDFRRVTGKLPLTAVGRTAIIVGTAGKSSVIDKLLNSGKLPADQLRDKTEKYILTIVDSPEDGIDRALVIAGSDKRGTIYGVYELSRQMGVSPWYWWADVPMEKQMAIYVKQGTYTEGEPAVRYRGIFLNDEAPALSGWTKQVFCGMNHNFYEKVFELILRLKGNFLWPAMWGNAFYDDDPLNGTLADEYGVVMGTSHHEPMTRAQQEWKRYGKGAWDYNKNAAELRDFWEKGLAQRKDLEKLVTVAMRGDGDEPMSEGTNIALLQRIVKDQRKIIEKVTGKKAEETPQVWALYKEVQDYYDKGMRVPDDVTLLLCDDNWGNLRKLPDVNAPKRKGGYGIYYHFDYVGAPRNYKWINVTQNERTWEQMKLAYEHGVDRLWVVNVGDLKPMEFPISFWFDFAWNPERFQANDVKTYAEQWSKEQFGAAYAKEIADMLNRYTKYNSRITPELLTDRVYSLENYNEFARVVDDYKDLAIDALRMYNLLAPDYRDAFDELVLFPINGMCNLYEMYYALAMNKHYAAIYDLRANAYADKVKECFRRDSLLTVHYNSEIAGGKWAHQMDQVRIGYNNWQEPPRSIMPNVEYVYRAEPKEKVFLERDGYVSMLAENYARAQGSDEIHWEVIPNLGRTGSAVSTFPHSVDPKKDDQVYLEYDFQTPLAGDVDVSVYLAPTLNFNANKGLRYALSIDGGEETIVNFNGDYDGSLGDWQGQRIIISTTKLKMKKADKHTLRVRVSDAAIVFEKFIIDFGGLKPSYLGAPESEYVNNNSPFPAFPPANPTARFDHDQMMEQLKLVYPDLQPSEAPNKSKYFTARSKYGIWTNYLQSWEPKGDYYTGSDFYEPLPLMDLSGMTADGWKERRTEIFKEVQQIYGIIPEVADGLKIRWNISEPVMRKEVRTRAGMQSTIPFREYTLRGEIDTSLYPELQHAPVISAVLRVPASVPEGTKVPVVVNLTWRFFGNSIFPDEDLWNTMAPAGIGVVYYDPLSLQPDNGAFLTDYIIGLANKGNWRKPADWGTLVAWGWGISRMIDYFEQSGSPVDATRVAVSGHSRFGKAALITMAYDTRVAAAFPSSSGAMGAAQSRRHLGEDLENCTDVSEYHWLAGKSMLYNGVDAGSSDGYMPRKVKQMPVDAEALIALCAPRPIFIGSGSDEQGDAWTDTYGQFLTTIVASPVYELLGKKGVIMTDMQYMNGKNIPMPQTDKAYLKGDIGYRRHHGGHEAAPNYPAFKEFLLKYWKK
jgi:hypothetical protein